MIRIPVDDGRSGSGIQDSMIFSFQPDGEVTLAPRVQNEAVDAIIDKIAYLGIQTIDCRIQRDRRVVALNERCSRYKKLYDLFRDFLASKNSLLNRRYLKERREKLAEIKFKKPSLELSDDEVLKRSAFLTRDLWGRLWLCYIMSKYNMYAKACSIIKAHQKVVQKDYTGMIAFVRTEIIDADQMAGTSLEFHPANYITDKAGDNYKILKAILTDKAGEELE